MGSGNFINDECSRMILKRVLELDMRVFTTLGLVFLLSLMISGAVHSRTPAPETPRLDSNQPLTPDDLFKVALRHNPDHQKNVQNASLAGANLRSAWGTLLPSLDVGYSISQSQFYNPTYINPDGTVAVYPRQEIIPKPVEFTDQETGYKWLGWDPSDSLEISYPVPEDESRSSSAWLRLQEQINLGGQQYYTIKNASISNRINDLAVEASKQNLLYLVRQSYYSVLANQKLLELAKKVLEEKNEQLRLAQARFDVGSVTELDVMQAEIDVGNQKNAILEAENNLKLAREELNRILGVELDSQYPLEDRFEVFEPQFDLEGLIAVAIQNRPDYLQYQEQERYYRNTVNIQRGQFLPNLTASLQHTRSENSGSNVDFTLSPRNRNTSVSLTLSWNLFNGFSDEAAYEESRVAYRNALHDRKSQEQLIEQNVRQAYYALMQTYDQSQVTQKNRELAEKQLLLEKERYRLGATSQLNLRTAQVTFEQAEVDYITNISDFWTNLAALEYAVGQPLH
jgi:outer membrane protein